jgi:hypothetical protein
MLGPSVDMFLVSSGGRAHCYVAVNGMFLGLIPKKGSQLPK